MKKDSFGRIIERGVMVPDSVFLIGRFAVIAAVYPEKILPIRRPEKNILVANPITIKDGVKCFAPIFGKNDNVAAIFTLAHLYSPVLVEWLADDFSFAGGGRRHNRAQHETE
jgi:hypothetical protein